MQTAVAVAAVAAVAAWASGAALQAAAVAVWHSAAAAAAAAMAASPSDVAALASRTLVPVPVAIQEAVVVSAFAAAWASVPVLPAAENTLGALVGVLRFHVAPDSREERAASAAASTSHGYW